MECLSLENLTTLSSKVTEKNWKKHHRENHIEKKVKTNITLMENSSMRDQNDGKYILKQTVSIQKKENLNDSSFTNFCSIQTRQNFKSSLQLFPTFTSTPFLQSPI